jgi:hypothetical protein
MGSRRGQAKLAVLLVACAVAVGGAIAAFVITTGGHDGKGLAYASTAPAPTTGAWAPISVSPPKVPIIAGGIPVDIDPMVKRTDFSTTLFPLPGAHRYRMTVFNTSNLGAINSFQWYPPTGVRIVKVLGSTEGHCTSSGLTGFGGNQFPTVVLYPNILCDDLDLKPPSCTCLGDGGAVTISFVTDRDVAVDGGDLRMRSATLVFDRIPVYQATESHSHGARPLMRIVVPACKAGCADSGGLTDDDRAEAQSAMDSLQNSNISLQLVTITRWVQSAPATCRIHLVSRSPNTFEIYVFWIPWLAAQPYVWLNMTVTNDPETSTFHLGTTQPVLPGGRLNPNGRTVNRRSVDTTLLSRYGAEQARKGEEILTAHGGDVFAKPGARCQVLRNGSLRLLPS